MKKIKEEVVEQCKRYWGRSTKTSFLTFLASKLAGINTSNAIHIGQQEDEKFIKKFLLENGKCFNPCSNNYPQNTSEWFRTIWQYRYKPQMPFSKAFDCPNKGFYKFSQDYIRITKNHALKGKKLALSHVFIWLYRSKNYNDTEELIDLKKQFIAEFNLTNEELESLFYDDLAEFQKIFDIEFDSSLTQEMKPISYSESLIAIDINGPPELGRIQTTIYRILRDTELTRRIKSLHAYQCQICGETIELANGDCYAEAHHIKPLGAPHNGPDIAENIVCVCPNHHVQLDYGSIELEKSKLRLNPNHEIGEEYLSYHNEKIFEQNSGRAFCYEMAVPRLSE